MCWLKHRFVFLRVSDSSYRLTTTWWHRNKRHRLNTGRRNTSLLAPITSELRSTQEGFKQYQRAERQIQEIKYTEEEERRRKRSLSDQKKQQAVRKCLRCRREVVLKLNLTAQTAGETRSYSEISLSPIGQLTGNCGSCDQTADWLRMFISEAELTESEPESLIL